MEHGYGFSVAVGTIGEWFLLVLFFVRGRTVDGGGVVACKSLEINILTRH